MLKLKSKLLKGLKLKNIYMYTVKYTITKGDYNRRFRDMKVNVKR